jgi:hypothetical protein
MTIYYDITVCYEPGWPVATPARITLRLLQPPGNACLSSKPSDAAGSTCRSAAKRRHGSATETGWHGGKRRY